MRKRVENAATFIAMSLIIIAVFALTGWSLVYDLSCAQNGIRFETVHVNDPMMECDKYFWEN